MINKSVLTTFFVFVVIVMVFYVFSSSFTCFDGASNVSARHFFFFFVRTRSM